MSLHRKCTQCFGFFPEHELVEGRCPRHRLAPGQVKLTVRDPTVKVVYPGGDPKVVKTRWCAGCGRREVITNMAGGRCPDCQQIRDQAKVTARLRAKRRGR